MLTPNRRDERQPEKLRKILIDSGFSISSTIDLSYYEDNGNVLEGTGNIVFSSDYKVAFAMSSPQTDKQLFNKYCKQFGYKPVFFHAYDSASKSIYHTNVIMAIGGGFAVLCSESITDMVEKEMVYKTITDLGLERIDITLKQVEQFCGNIIQLKSNNGDKRIILSRNAYNGFNIHQKRMIPRYGTSISIDIDTIEKIGGGSARCMMAEVILPKLMI